MLLRSSTLLFRRCCTCLPLRSISPSCLLALRCLGLPWFLLRRLLVDRPLAFPPAEPSVSFERGRLEDHRGVAAAADGLQVRTASKALASLSLLSPLPTAGCRLCPPARGYALCGSRSSVARPRPGSTCMDSMPYPPVYGSRRRTCCCRCCQGPALCSPPVPLADFFASIAGFDPPGACGAPAVAQRSNRMASTRTSRHHKLYANLRSASGHCRGISLPHFRRPFYFGPGCRFPRYTNYHSPSASP